MTVPSATRTSAANMFIGGVPMKPGDEEVRRLVVEALRRVDLLQRAHGHDGDAVPIVIASTWSCVT